MPVSTELACMLEAMDEPAFLIRPTDMTVAAVNAAFCRAFGAFVFEGKLCWEALHRADDCARCGLGCPLAQARANDGEAHVLQTQYFSSRVQRYSVTMRPIHRADGTTHYWLERIVVQKGLGSIKYTRGQVGSSHAHAVTVREMTRAAGNSQAVLIVGEPGMGKELYARTIHENSARASLPFVTVAASMLGAKRAERMLFGEASAGQPGLVQRAAAGTLFIEELADMAPAVQMLLEQGMHNGFFVLSDNRTVPAPFRLMASSTQELDCLKQAGRMVPRLAELFDDEVIRLVPLRHRREDIGPLAKHFVRGLVPVGTYSITDEAVAVLEQCDWPGNMRALERALYRAAIQTDDKVIRPHDLELEAERTMEVPFVSDASIVPLQEMRDRYVRWAAKTFKGSRTELARVLGVSERTLYRLVAQAQSDR